MDPTTFSPLTIGILIAVFAYFVSCMVAGVYVADAKSRSTTEGFFFGILFGPIGVLIVACLPMGTVGVVAPFTPKPVLTARQREAADLAADEATEAAAVARHWEALSASPVRPTTRKIRPLLGEVKE